MRLLPHLLVAVVLLSTTGCRKKDTRNAIQTIANLADVPAPPTVVNVAAPAPAPARMEDFSGTYVSSAGATVTFTQLAGSVEASPTAKHGRITCTAVGRMLDCLWSNRGSAGREILFKESDGTLRGTWGYGSSARGGTIWFVPKSGAVVATGRGRGKNLAAGARRR